MGIHVQNIVLTVLEYPFIMKIFAIGIRPWGAGALKEETGSRGRKGWLETWNKGARAWGGCLMASKQSLTLDIE